MKKVIMLLAMLIVFSVVLPAQAAPKWEQVGQHITQAMGAALDIYNSGDNEGAKNAVNDIYYGIYEKDGLETAIRNTVAAKNANLTEYQFSKLKKLMTQGADSAQVKEAADTLLKMIDGDVQSLQGSHAAQGGWASFWPAFIILLREGIEAILVLAAIIAYLCKSGNEKYLSYVYNYSIAAIIASFITAYIFNSIAQEFGAGANQEIVEGVTVLIAVVVLLSVSLWMGGKSNAKVWEAYIQKMVKTSMSTGRARTLGFAAFLAVYREGAEVVLFYQALFNNAAGDVEMIWLGFAAACVALAIIFTLIRVGALRIPLRPFFIGTSIFMYILAVSFAGSGIEELQEGGLISITPIEGIPMPNIDILGIYPTYETMAIQVILVIAAIVGIVYYKKKDSSQPT
ncbi:FTR1 family iron permease [Pectinatus cerevisiiphilus]|uniref:High-affinity iron transporter n=1 Tax=Pectinatus cerevisiiphilus TaxID=86956 RepID=A0A4R3KEF8_9FIRM|nr:FTR1 family protein [Pectinatus cerevisiiphilus]TCS81349.1 high-affinity iron transporter [Pectinatus cerevisiiphilus]